MNDTKSAYDVFLEQGGYTILWSELPNEKDLNMIILDPVNARYHRQEKTDYFRTGCVAIEDWDEVQIKKGDSFSIDFPVKLFGLKLMHVLRQKRLHEQKKVILSLHKFEVISKKPIFDVAKWE